MSSSRKTRSSLVAATAAAITVLFLNAPASAAYLVDDLATGSDSLVTVNHMDSNKLRKADVSLEQLRELLKQSEEHQKSLNKLDQLVSDQARTIDTLKRQLEEMKRNTSSSSSSSSNELDRLKRGLDEEKRRGNQLERKVEELSRKVK